MNKELKIVWANIELNHKKTKKKKKQKPIIIDIEIPEWGNELVIGS